MSSAQQQPPVRVVGTSYRRSGASTTTVATANLAPSAAPLPSGGLIAGASVYSMASPSALVKKQSTPATLPNLSENVTPNPFQPSAAPAAAASASAASAAANAATSMFAAWGNVAVAAADTKISNVTTSAAATATEAAAVSSPIITNSISPIDQHGTSAPLQSPFWKQSGTSGASQHQQREGARTNSGTITPVNNAESLRATPVSLLGSSSTHDRHSSACAVASSMPAKLAAVGGGTTTATATPASVTPMLSVLGAPASIAVSAGTESPVDPAIAALRTSEKASAPSTGSANASAITPMAARPAASNTQAPLPHRPLVSVPQHSANARQQTPPSIRKVNGDDTTTNNGLRMVPTEDDDIVAIKGSSKKKPTRSEAYAMAAKSLGGGRRREDSSSSTVMSSSDATTAASATTSRSQSESESGINRRNRQYQAPPPTAAAAVLVGASPTGANNAAAQKEEEEYEEEGPRTGRLGKAKNEPKKKRKPAVVPEGQVEVPLVRPRYERKSRTNNQISVGDYAGDSNLGTVSTMLHQTSTERLSIRHGDNYYEGTVNFHTYSVFRHGARKIIARSVGYASDGDLVLHRFDVGEKSDSNNDSFAMIKRHTTEIHDAVCLDPKAKRPMTDGEEEYLRRKRQINLKKHRKYPGVKAPRNKKIRQRLMNDAVTASEDFKRAFARAERRLKAERRAARKAANGGVSGADSSDDDDSSSSSSSSADSFDSKGRLRPRANGAFQNVPPRYQQMTLHQEEAKHDAYLDKIGLNAATLHHTSSAKATPTTAPADPNSAEARFSLLNTRLRDEVKRALISEYLTGLIAELDQDFTDYIRFSVPQVAVQTPPFGPATPPFGAMLPPAGACGGGCGTSGMPDFACLPSAASAAAGGDFSFPTNKVITDRSGFGGRQPSDYPSPFTLSRLTSAATVGGGGGSAGSPLHSGGNTQSLLSRGGAFPSQPLSAAALPHAGGGGGNSPVSHQSRQGTSPLIGSEDSSSHHPTPTAPMPSAIGVKYANGRSGGASQPATPTPFGFGGGAYRPTSATEIQRVADALPDNAPPPLSYAFRDGYGRLMCHAVASYYKLLSSSEEDKATGSRKTVVQFPESKRARAMAMVLPAMPFLQYLRMKTRNNSAGVGPSSGGGPNGLVGTPTFGPTAVAQQGSLSSPIPQMMMYSENTMPPMPMAEDDGPTYCNEDGGAIISPTAAAACPLMSSAAAQTLFAGVDADGQPLTKTAIKKLKKELKELERIANGGGGDSITDAIGGEGGGDAEAKQSKKKPSKNRKKKVAVVTSSAVGGDEGALDGVADDVTANRQ